MPQGDKYIKFTDYLVERQKDGRVELYFSDIEKILGEKLPPSSRKNQWSNNNSRSLSAGWLNAGFIITLFPDLSESDPKVSFSYDQERADAILTGNTVDKRADYESVLKAFLQDIDCLESLSEWSNKFNLFDVLKLSRTEIRHSNMLAWLFDPNENHGLGDRVLRGLINFIILRYKPKNIDEFSMVSMDLYSFEVRREWKDIDLLLVSNDAKVAICIENKIDSSEHSEQLEKYKKIMCSNYEDSGYDVVYIYLSPDGKLPSDELWNVMTYQDVLQIIERESSRGNLNIQVKTLIDNYIDILRREIVEDQRLKEVCAEIYAKHKEALDLIYEHRPDEILNMTAIVKDWCAAEAEKENSNLIFDAAHSQKGVVRFQTKTMDDILPNLPDNMPKSVWGNEHIYFYEIHISADRIRIMLELSVENLPSDYRKKLENVGYKLGDCKKYKQLEVWDSQSKDFSNEETIDEVLKTLYNRGILTKEKEITKKLENLKK